MRASWLLAQVLLVVAAPGLSFAEPQAEQVAGHRNGFKFYSAALAAGLDVDSGNVNDAGSALEDTVLTFVPTALAYRNQSRRADLQFIYEPEIALSGTDTSLSAWNHVAALTYVRQATRNIGFQAGGSFLRTNDRNRQSNGLTFSPRGLYVEGRVSFAATYRYHDDTDFSVQVDSRLTQTTVPESVSASGSIDDRTSTFSARLSRKIGSMHQVVIGYGYLESAVLNPEDLPQGASAVARGQDTLNVNYTLDLRSGLQLTGSVGTIRLPQNVGSDQYTYSWLGRAQKNWSSLSIGGGYQRTLSGLFQLDSTAPADQIRDPLLSRSVAEVADVLVTGRLGSRVTINHRLGLSRTFVAGTDESFAAVSAFLQVGFDVADRISPYVNFSYWDQNGTRFIRPISRTRITAGLRFFWDSPRVRRVAGDQENVRSILPVRRTQ